MLISGSRDAYEASRHQFESFGRTSYVSREPGMAYISEMAVLLAYLPMAVGLFQGLRICEDHDLSPDWFRHTVIGLYPRHIEMLLQRVAGGGDPPPRDLDASTDVWGQAAEEYAEYLGELGVDAGMYEALHRLFADASACGTPRTALGLRVTGGDAVS